MYSHYIDTMSFKILVYLLDVDILGTVEYSDRLVQSGQKMFFLLCIINHCIIAHPRRCHGTGQAALASSVAGASIPRKSQDTPKRPEKGRKRLYFQPNFI